MFNTEGKQQLSGAEPQPPLTNALSFAQHNEAANVDVQGQNRSMTGSTMVTWRRTLPARYTAPLSC